MKILNQVKNDKTGELSITMLVERDDDIFECYNLIAMGDSLTTTTTRNIVHENSVGKTEKTRTTLKITIHVESIEFEPDSCSLRVSGRNILESDKIKIGQYHSVDITIGTKYQLIKDNYDDTLLITLKDIASPTPKDHIVVITMQHGLANICVVSSDTTLLLGHIERNIPKKKENQIKERDRAINQFFDMIYDTLKKHLSKFQYRSVVVIGSPGFLNNEFLRYAIELATKVDDIEMIKCCKNKFLTCHTSSGYKSAVSEVFNDQDVKKRIEGLRIFEQINTLNEFHDMLRDDEDRVCYGMKEVLYANDIHAIGHLLIVDLIYKANDPKQRKRMKDLMDSVTSLGGQVHRFNSRHFSGQQVANLTGIAAILRFPVPGLSDLVGENIHDDNPILGASDKSTVHKSKDQEATEAFAASLVAGAATVGEEYDEFDTFDELDDETEIIT